MNELINITTNSQGDKVVSARDLYEFLEIRRDFTTWCKRMFEYGFTEDVDYTRTGESVNQYVTRFDYALTLDTAKEIAMLQRSEKGKQARQYFIECEKKLREVIKTLSVEEMIIAQAQSVIEVKSKVAELEKRQNLLEAQTKTIPDYFTVVGYASLNKIQVGLQLAAKLGSMASRLCKNQGINMGELPDPRFGKVKTYPTSILEQVFQSAIN
jgi:anti-repressor protein